MRLLSFVILFSSIVHLDANAVKPASNPGRSEYYESLTYNWSDVGLAFELGKSDLEIPNQSELVYFADPKFSKEISEKDSYRDCYYKVVAELSQKKSSPDSRYKIREFAMDSSKSARYVSVLFNANPIEQKGLPAGAGGSLVISEQFFREKVISDAKTCNTSAFFDFLNKILSHLNTEENFPVGGEGYKKIDFDKEARVQKSEQFPHGKEKDFGRFICASTKEELQAFIIERVSDMEIPDEQGVKSLVRDIASCRRARPEVYQPVIACFEPFKYLLPRSLLMPQEAYKHDLGMAIPDTDYYSGKGMRNPAVMNIPKILEAGSPLAEAINSLEPIEEILRIQDSINEENRKKGIKEKVHVFRNISAFQGMDLRDVALFYNKQLKGLESNSEAYKKLVEQRDAHLKDFGTGRIVVFIERTNAQDANEAQVFQMSYPEKPNERSTSQADSLFLMSQIGIELNRAKHSSGAPNIVRLGDQRKIFTNGKHTAYERVTTSDSCFKCHSQDSPVWLLGAHPNTDTYLVEAEKRNLDHFNKQIKKYQREGIFLDSSPFQGLELPVLGEGHPQREEILSALISDVDRRRKYTGDSTPIDRAAINHTMSSCVDCHDRDDGQYRALGFSDVGLIPSAGEFSREKSAVQAWLHKMSPKDVKLNPLETYITAKAFEAEMNGETYNVSSPSGDTSVNVEITGAMDKWYMDLFINNNACLKNYLAGSKPHEESLNH